MRIVFAGTPEFAARALTALHVAGHDIMLVLTQPDRPAGRGLAQKQSAVKVRASALGLAIQQPPSLRDSMVQNTLRAAHPEVMVVAAYGLLLPRAVLEIPGRGCLNIHASLLPRWRGAAPIQRAILAGDTETGITIMQMDEGLDTGAMRLRESCPIAAQDNASTLHDKLADLGARCIVRALADWPPPQPQDPSAATYAAKVTKSEAVLDWTKPADELDREVRAFNPAPGAQSTFGGHLIKIWRAEPVAARGAAGAVVSSAGGIVVGCGSGALRLLELQRAGGRRMPAEAFLAGNPVVPGARFGD